MTDIFKETKNVSIEALYLDPNNPRLSRTAKPGYEDAEKLFDEKVQVELINNLMSRGDSSSNTYKDEFGVDELITTILAKGWIPNAEPIWVWEHPEVKGKYIVLEGNRRSTAIKIILSYYKNQLEEALKAAIDAENFKRIEDVKKKLAIISQIELSAQNLEVKLLKATNENELKRDKRGLLSIRHIKGAKPWDDDAADNYLLEQYKDLYSIKNPDSKIYAWDDDLIQELATESSIRKNDCKVRLKAISWFEDFKVRYEFELPNTKDGKKDKFTKRDYFLFREISKNKSVRETIFKIKDTDIHLSDEAGEAIFKWVFKEPSHLSADENTNVFYAHRNVQNLSLMIKYDEVNQTSFSKSYDIENPDDAEHMSENYDVKFRLAKQNAKQSNILDNVVSALKKITTAELYEGGESIKEQIKYINSYSKKILTTMEQNDG
tara:strand:- start:3877 stop:5181 length:1305 start_codon:yes stop_codon:yes gene_type:complete